MGWTDMADMADINGAQDKIKVGVSSCLLGQEVRYDGGHKHLALLTKWALAWECRGPRCIWLVIPLHHGC